MMLRPLLRAGAASLLLATGAARAAGPRPLLPPLPTLSLPWAEHGRLSQVTGLAPVGWAQEAYVVPQRPGKNLVRYFDFHWRSFDYLDDDGSSGVRFYFYDREYPVARIAAAFVRDSWRYLSDRFQYKPSFKVPYILYNSYSEFLETNVFQVQEGVLGVTSPASLEMSLSYAGERGAFTLVSTHEMTHQFQIQKVAERAQTAGVDNPIGSFPLWFTEGLAEYYAHDQRMDAETEMFLRDVVLNPQPDLGYDFPTLEEDRPYAYLYTYKYGQAKLVFLAETYGERVIQGVLDQSPRLSGGGRRGDPRDNGFMALLGRVAGESPSQMNARWQSWAKKRVLPTFLGAKQDLPDVVQLKLPDELDWFVSTSDGNLLFYRGVERETGRAKLVLVDRRDPGSSHQIAIDQQPGTESLHPVLKSVMAVHETGIAWFAQAGDSDVLHYRALRRSVRDLDEKERERRPLPRYGMGRGALPGESELQSGPGPAQPVRARVDLALSAPREIRVLRDGIIEAGDPTFSPDGTRLAFFGLDRDGKSDIYVIDVREKDPHARRLTEDLYSERDLAWGDDGIVYASDATESGKYNLFLLDPATAARHRLTDAPVDQRYPLPLAGGATVFASDAGGKFDLWFLQDGRVHRITDFSTGISHPGYSPNGIYGISFYGARFRLFEVPSPALVHLDDGDAIPASYAATVQKAIPFPDEPIPYDAPAYDPLAFGRNWRLEGGGAAIGGAGIGSSTVGQAGLLFDDVLRDRTILANLAIYGSFDFTDALAFYVDKSERMTWGVGLFHTFEQGRDTRFPSANQCTRVTSQFQGSACEVFYFQREFGAEGLLSYPLSTFSRIDFTARAQGVSRSFLGDFAFDLVGNPTTIPAADLNGIRGFDPELRVAAAYGWDTTRYALGGANGGTSFLLELGGGELPLRGNDGPFVYAQTDAIHTIGIAARTRINTRLAAGLSQGSRFGRHFYLSSFDNLRGYRFGDQRLLGDGYYVAQAELNVPLDMLIRFAFFSGITGVVGFDFGGVVDTNRARLDHPDYSRAHAALAEAWANRSADYVLGVNLGLGAFELRVQFAHGIAVGGIVPETDSNGNATWVPNISLHYAYF